MPLYAANHKLFSGTIRENLLWGRRDATPEEVEAAADAVGTPAFNLIVNNGPEAGQVVAVSLVSINTTARRRAELALQEVQAQLENRVRQRTAELQKALERVSELSQLKANFISNISHELRTPLTSIKLQVEALRGGAGRVRAHPLVPGPARDRPRGGRLPA